MDWMKIGSAMLLAALIVFIWPRARAAMKNAPPATGDDWRSVLLPILIVVGFVLLLIASVR